MVTLSILSLRYGELRTATFSLVVQRNGTAPFAAAAETTTKYGGMLEKRHCTVRFRIHSCWKEGWVDIDVEVPARLVGRYCA